MPQFAYQTRDSFLKAVRTKYPEYNDMGDEHLYKSMIEKFPEYQQQIAENYQTLEPELDSDMDPTADEKTFFTGMNEIFSKDFYKLIPFVRDAEFFEMKDMLGASERLKNGEATEQDMTQLRKWATDEERPTSWAYQTLMLLAHIPAYAVEFGALSTLSGGWAGFAKAGAGKAARTGAKATLKRTLKKAAEKHGKNVLVKSAIKAGTAGAAAAETLGATTAGQAVRIAGQKVNGVLGSIMNKGIGLAGAKNAAGQSVGVTSARLAKAKMIAHTGGRDGFMKALAKAGGGSALKGAVTEGGATLGLGVAEATVRTALRAPQSVINAQRRMLPELQMAEGIDGDMVIELLDDGEDLLPALAKGFGDMGIEMFSETVGNSLGLADRLMGGHVFRAAVKGSLKEGKLHNIALKTPILRRYIDMLIAKGTPANAAYGAAKEKMAKFGWNGIIEEMFEERVGDVLRASTGIQDNWFPTPEQLASEAVAFALFGGMGTAAHEAKKLTILGGAGLETTRKNKAAIQLDEGGVMVEGEYEEHVDGIYDTLIEERKNPDPLTKLLRKVEIFGHKPFEGYTRAGSMESLINETYGQDLVMFVGAEIEKGASKEEVRESSQKYIDHMLKQSGAWVVQNQEQKDSVMSMIDNGQIEFVSTPKGQYYKVSEEAYEKDPEAIKASLGEQSIILFDQEGWESLKRTTEFVTVFEEEDFKVKPGSEEFEANLDKYAKVFRTSDRQRIEALYKVLHTAMNSEHTRGKLGLQFAYAPAAAVEGKGAELTGVTGYETETPDKKEIFLINAFNEDGVVVVNRLTTFSGLAEEIIEASVKETIASDGELNTQVKQLAETVRNHLPQDLQGYGYIDILSKTYLSTHLGLSSGHRAKDWANISLPENVSEALGRMMQGAVGQKVLEALSTGIQMETQEESKEADKDDEKPAKADEGSETAESTSEEAKPPESAETPSEDTIIPKGTVQQATEDFLKEDITLEELEQTAVDNVTSKQGMEQKMEIRRLLRIIRADYENEEQRIADIEQVLFSKIGFLSFAGNQATIEEGMSEEDVLGLLINDSIIDGLRDQFHFGRTDITDLSQSIITAALDVHLGKNFGIQLLYDMVHNDAERNYLQSIIAGGEVRFDAFLRMDNPPTDSLQMLREVMRTNFTGNEKDGVETLKSIVNRYQNIHLLPAVAIRNGKLVTLNIRNLEARIAKQISYKIPVVLGGIRANQEVSARQDLLNWIESASNQKQKIEILSTISGQPYSLISKALTKGPIDNFYNKLVTNIRESVVNDLSMSQILSTINTVMTKLRYSNLTFPAYLSKFGGSQQHSVQFTNVDGHNEMAFRESSHMIQAVHQLANEFGWADAETALVMFNGSKTGKKGKNARKLNGEALMEELYKLFQQSSNEGFYLQTLGRMGGKNQTYLTQAPRYSDEAIDEAVDNLNLSEAEKNELHDMAKDMRLQSDAKEKNRTRFQLHFEINMARMNPIMHGILDEGMTLEDMNKRASQIPTGGIALDGKDINVLIVEDPMEMIDGKLMELFDGQVLYTGAFGERYAQSMGSHYMNGKATENNIKPNISYIDSDGKRRMIKGAWKNIDALENHVDYKAIKAWLDSMEGQIDAIVFSSAAKVGYKSETTKGFLKKGVEGYEVDNDSDINLTQIPAREFISVQNLNFSEQASLKKDSKQKATDTIHGEYADEVAELHQQNSADLRGMIETESISRLLSDSVLALEQDLKDFKERNAISGKAQAVLNRFLRILRPEERFNNYQESKEGKETNLLESDAYYAVAEMIHELSWTTEADKDYFKVVKEALANDQSEYDPAVSSFIEGMKSRLLQRMIDRKLQRSLAQKVSAGSMYIPSFEKDPKSGKMRMPWIMTYTQGVREALGFKTKEAALQYARQFDDMRVIKNGQLTDQVKEWEIRTPAEAKELGMEGWVVPGGYVFESRIPAENMQSHIPHRLWKAPGSMAQYGNISITSQDISRRKGEDYDGDTGFQYIMFQNPKSELEYRRNLALMLQAEDYYNPAFQEAVMNSVNAEMFSDLPAMRKMSPEEMKKRRIRPYTMEGQTWLSESSATSLDALARVASNIKFYDIAQKLGFGISEQIEFNTQAGWVKVNFNAQDVKKLTPQEILFRKRYYGTLLVNLTVDDISHPQMYAMGMNEITAPMMQALLALDTSLKDEKQFRRRMNSIVELMHSVPIQAYVKARRHMQSLDYDAAKEQKVKGKWLSNEAMVSKLMLEELGLKTPTHDMKAIMNLHRLLEDINAVSQTMDTMYEAPKSSAEFMLREDGLSKLENNNFKIINVESAMEGEQLNIHLRPIKTSLDTMEKLVFNKSPLLSETGRQIYNGLKEYQKRDKAFLQHTEKTIARVLMGHAIDVNSDIDAMNFEVFTESLIEQIKEERDKGVNVFLDILQSDYIESGKDHYTKILSLNNAYTGNQPEMSEALRDRAREDFEKLDAELQKRLMLYAVQVYGVNETTWNGSFFPLIGRYQREQISTLYEQELNEFNAGNRLWVADMLLRERGKYKRNYLEDTNWQFGNVYTGRLMSSIDVIFERVDERAEPKKNKDRIKEQTTRIVLSQELDARQEVMSAGLKAAILEMGGKVVDADAFNSLIESAQQSYEEAQAKAVEALNAEALEALNEKKPSMDKMIGSDGANFSISRLHETLAKESALFMAGATGAHKIYMQNMDKHQAERIIGRLYRVLWEIGVGARQDIFRGRKLSEEQKQLGMDVLSAITAQITGTETVVTGYISEHLSVEDAIKRLIEVEVRNLPEKVKTGTPNASMKQALANAIQDGFVKSNAAKAKTYAGITEMLIEADVKRWAKEQKVKEGQEISVPVKVPQIHSLTATEIMNKYQSEKADWMIDANELKREIQEQFELARIRANADESAEDELIAKRENYLPVYYAAQEVRKKKRTPTVSEGFVASESRKGDYNDYATASKHGRVPVTTNAAELFEIWTRQTSNHKMLASAWQTMLMTTDPDGSAIIIPEFAGSASRKVIPEGMIHAYAEKLAYFNGETLNGMSPRDYVASKVPTASDSYTRLETNMKSMPYVWVKKGNAEKLAKMTIGAKKEGKYWQHWERLVGWTKFMAIGFPWVSTFHYAALLESEIASRGLKDSSAWNPVKAYKEFQGFRKELENNPESARKWFQWGLTATLENPDYAQGVVDEDLESISTRLKENKHLWMASKVDGFREMKKNWDTRLWIRFHGPLKLWVAEGILNSERESWEADPANAKKIFPEDKYGREIAELVDQMFGGINNNRYLWKTPVATQVTHSVFFAKDWTEAALGIAGAGNIPGLGNIIGGNSEIQNRIRYTKYWPAFGAIVMFGIPQFIQAALWAITRPVGDDDDEPFTFLNEHDRRTWIDVTPLVRMIDPRDKKDERRVYLRWAKQGYEIGDWVKDPLRTAGHKMSIPLKWAYEHMSGYSVGGWDMAFKDQAFFGALQAQGSFWKSRAGDTAMRFIPFTVQDIIKGRPTAWFAKAKAGKHEWYAAKQLTELYLGYVSGSNWEKTKNHQKNILIIGSDLLEAVQKNGYDATKVQKDALQNARAELYIELEEAMHRKNIKKAEGIAIRLQALEASAFRLKKMFQSNPLLIASGEPS